MGFCEEYEKKYYRKIIQKKGIRCYALGQIGSAATVTFGACMLGITGYLGVLMCIMPAPEEKCTSMDVRSDVFGILDNRTLYF